MDRDSNNVSLLEVIEQLELELDSQNFEWPIAIPFSGDLMTLWARDDPEVPETGQHRLRLLAPDGAELMEEVILLVDLSEHRRARIKGGLHGLKLGGPGWHEFEVSARAADEHHWTVVASLPLEFRVKPLGVANEAEGGGEA